MQNLHRVRYVHDVPPLLSISEDSTLVHFACRDSGVIDAMLFVLGRMVEVREVHKPCATLYVLERPRVPFGPKDFFNVPIFLAGMSTRIVGILCGSFLFFEDRIVYEDC